MAQITVNELDSLIRKNINEKGLRFDISNDQIEEIKQKIKNIAFKKEENKPVITNEEENISMNLPAEEIRPQTITQTTTINKDNMELSQKEGELKQKEEEISKREASIANKEAELQRKEDELKYKPVIPSVLDNMGAEKVFIFNTNEISVGAEALTNTSLRLMSNPDEKKSMHDIWAQEGKKKAEVYLVKFEKIGEIELNPFAGTSDFVEKRIEDGQIPSSVPADGLTPEDAQKSQEPTEGLKDAIAPVSSAILPAANDMGLLNAVNVEQILKDKLEDIMRNYFLQTYPKV
jgi:hypothetical protein